MEQAGQKFVKIKKDKFKWFIAILVFILLLILIQKVGEKPKSVFDSCYEKCTSLGRPLKEDGVCDDGYYKDGNWCKPDGSAGKCLSVCMK